MSICRFSVVRPTVTIVFMLLLVVFGYMAMTNLPVREYPDIDTPTISISTSYDGARTNAEDFDKWWNGESSGPGLSAKTLFAKKSVKDNKVSEKGEIASVRMEIEE